MARKKRDTSGKIRVRVLGGVDFQIGSRRIGMNTEVLFGLGLYLTTRAGERIPREEILETFWAKGTDAQRRHALRQLLYRLRKKGLMLDEDGDHVRVDPKRVDSDVRAALDDEWVEKASAAEVEAAGKFGPVFSRRQASGFLEWMDGLRDEVALRHRKASLRQITVARREGRWADLERWAQQVLKSDPLNEEATLARAESAAMAGSKTIAIEILDNFLAEVGDISPDLGKPALALRKRLAERRADWTVRGPKEVPLVGRTELMSRLTGLVEAAWRGEGSAVVLVGAPGIGKTRLAMETRAYAELKGMRTVVVRAEAGEADRPLGLALALAERVIELEGAIACDPDSLALIRRSLAVQSAGGAPIDLAPARPMHEHFAHAMTRLIEACVFERRLVILVDDLHHSDAASRQFLGRTIAMTHGKRVGWIITSRDRAGLDRHSGERSASALSVRPLSTDDAVELVSRTLEAHSLSLQRSRQEEIARTAGGNPLFARELSVERARHTRGDKLPDSLQGIITERIGRMSPETLRYVRYIALLESAATPSRLARMLDGPAPLGRVIEELEDAGMLTLGQMGALELHECWRCAILADISPATSAVLSLECVTQIESETAALDNPRTAWRVAELLRRAGEHGRALMLYRDAAQRLFSAGFPAEAAKVFCAALAIADRDIDRVSIAVEAGRSHLASGAPEHCLELVRDYLEPPVISEGLDPVVRAHLLALGAESMAKLCVNHEGVLTALVELLASGGVDCSEVSEPLLTAARLAANGHFSELEARVAQIGPAGGLDSFPLPVLLARVIFHSEAGPHSQLELLQQSALTQVRAGIAPGLECSALRILAHSKRLGGDWGSAIDCGILAYTRARSLALPDDASIAAELLAYIFLDTQDTQSAGHWIGCAGSVFSRPEYEQRRTSLLHAADRLAMQAGDWGAVLDSASARLATVQADPVRLSRTTQLLTFAIAEVTGGSRRKAKELTNDALDGLEEFIGRAAGDYCAEMAMRNLSALGMPGEATSLGIRHIRQRQQRFRRPLAPFFSSLRQIEESAGVST